MLVLISVVLAIALGFALKICWSDRRALRGLHVAVQNNRSFRANEIPGATSRDWQQLCADINELIQELSRLQQLRSGQLAQLEATLGSLQEAVLIVDDQNQILLANSAFAAIFPKANNIVNHRLESVLRSSVFLNYVESVRQQSAQPQKEIEFAEGNQSIWVEITGSIIPPLDGQKGNWVLFVIHDITELKKLELVRKEFVANVSHELRTPLSVIKGYAETLVDGHHEMPVEDRDRFLKTIQRHTERLNSLLEDLLTLSKLESINPGLRRESTDLPALLENIVEDYRARPAAEGHTLVLAGDIAIEPLLVDPLKVTQVLENLLDNALKYTPKGCTIRLSSNRKENEVELCVADDGAGIPEADLPHLFERFYRVDKGRSRDKGGTGLGLSIVKHIVQLHHGRVWVESELGKGTAFYFTLPLRSNGV